MKRSSHVILWVVVFLSAGCSRYEYLPNPEGTPAGTIPGLTCNTDVKKTIKLPLTIKSKFFVFEVTNTGTCTSEVTAVLLSTNQVLARKMIAYKQHVVYIGDVPTHPVPDTISFTLGCPSSDSTSCGLKFNARICDSANQKPPHPAYSVESTGEKRIKADPAAVNKCITAAGDQLELLAVDNASKGNHTLDFTVSSTCLCPEFHLDPPGITLAPNTTLTVKAFPVKKNTKVSFKAYCGGNLVQTPSCSGSISQITLQPK